MTELFARPSYAHEKLKNWSERKYYSHSTLLVASRSQLQRVTFVCGGGRARRFMSIVWLAGDSYEALGLVSEEEGMMFVNFFTVVLRGGSRVKKTLRLYQAFAFNLVLSFHFSPSLSLIRFRLQFNNIIMLLTLMRQGSNILKGKRNAG